MSRHWSVVLFGSMVLALGDTNAFGQAMVGDLDANHEVNLSDVNGFVGCLSGPDLPAFDPQCAAAMFDEDNDVDLRDAAGFQGRFGFGVGPPRIARLLPPPGDWIVDDVGLTHIEVGFSEPVVVPREAIIVWPLSAGLGDTRMNAFTFDYETDSCQLTIMFDPPIRDDRVTLVFDYLIEDLSGRPLDGEIFNPHSASLPSGDGLNGGQAVCLIYILQGDANRDGVVDETDSAAVNASLGLCDDADSFNPDMDLNGDGCVDLMDLNITSNAIGRTVPQGDGAGPRVTATFADGPFGSFDWLGFSISETLDVFKVTERSCFLLDADENVIVPTFAGAGVFGDSIDFYFIPAFAHCNLFRINLSNAIFDLSGEPLEPMEPCVCLVDCPAQGGGP